MHRENCLSNMSQVLRDIQNHRKDSSMFPSAGWKGLSMAQHHACVYAYNSNWVPARSK